MSESPETPEPKVIVTLELSQRVADLLTVLTIGEYAQGVLHVPATSEQRGHLLHMTDGRWHDNCLYCVHRRCHGGTGLEAFTSRTSTEGETSE